MRPFLFVRKLSMDLPEVICLAGDDPEGEEEIGNSVRRDRVAKAVFAADESLIGKGAENP